MKKYNFLVLTDHSNHSEENSLYALMAKLSIHPQSKEVFVASRGNAQNQVTRYVAKKAGAEALGGDLKPNAFYQKSKVSDDEKSGKDIIISRGSGKGYMQKSKVVDGKVEYKHKSLSQ